MPIGCYMSLTVAAIACNVAVVAYHGAPAEVRWVCRAARTQGRSEFGTAEETVRRSAGLDYW